MQIRDDAWIISDTHFRHEHIIQYAGRPFSCVSEMDDAMVSNWNSAVGKDGQVVFLGDFSLAPGGVVKSFRKALNGKIILFLGNHDRSHSVKWWLDAGFESVIEYPIIYKNFFILSHEPVDWISERLPVLNIHGHIHEKTIYNLQNNHYNVSVENINYTPVRLQDILNKGYELAERNVNASDERYPAV